MNKMTFKHTNELGDIIKITVSDTPTIDQAIETFTRFMLACGYQFPTQNGHLDWVDPNEIGTGLGREVEF